MFPLPSIVENRCSSRGSFPHKRSMILEPRCVFSCLSLLKILYTFHGVTRVHECTRADHMVHRPEADPSAGDTLQRAATCQVSSSKLKEGSWGQEGQGV